MNAWETALAAAGIACGGFYLLCVPRVVRIWRATHRPVEAERAKAAQARTGVTQQHLDDAEFLRIIRTEFTDYGHGIADYYDTTGDS